MSKNRLVKVISSSGSRPLVAVKTQRNDLCPCGSKKKFKKCCNSQTRYYFKQDKK